MMAQLIDRKQLKQQMKDLLRSAQVGARGMTLLYLALVCALNLTDSLTGLVNDGLPAMFVSILTSLLGMVLSAGFVLYCMAVRRGERAEYLTLFDGFSFVGRIILLNIVEYLNRHPLVEAVHHPSLPSEPSYQLYQKYFPHGAGSIFTFEIKGDAQTAQTFIDNLAIFSLLANVADVKSLVIHPASTTHSQLTPEELLDQGIRPNTIRLSIGTENVKDLIAALEDAFAAVQSR